MNFQYNVHLGTVPQTITSEQLEKVAAEYELNTLIPGRYSSLFVLNILLHERVDGVNPQAIIDEIKHLEGAGPSLQTKGASQFTGAKLKGLWHKHFMPANLSILGHNLSNQLGKSGVDRIINEVFDPSRGATITTEMINELTHKIVTESLEKRADAGKLTGEWIIFAEESGLNYYLCTANHDSGDEHIASRIQSVCVHEFPFLSRYAA